MAASQATWPDEAAQSGLGFFRVKAAQLLAPYVQLTPEQMYEVLEAPRQADLGDIALPVPRLNKFSKIKGNPAEVASQIAAKVGQARCCLSAPGEPSRGSHRAGRWCERARPVRFSSVCADRGRHVRDGGGPVRKLSLQQGRRG